MTVPGEYGIFRPAGWGRGVAGLTRGPVKAEIAGSNPVAPEADQRQHFTDRYKNLSVFFIYASEPMNKAQRTKQSPDQESVPGDDLREHTTTLHPAELALEMPSPVDNPRRQPFIVSG